MPWSNGLRHTMVATVHHLSRNHNWRQPLIDKQNSAGPFSTKANGGSGASSGSARGAAPTSGTAIFPKLVYRGGSRTPNNLTPRPEIDTTGLSTFENLEQAVAPGGKAQVIDLSKLRAPLVGVSDAPPEGHVSIRPGTQLTSEVMQSIEEWAAARGADVTHPFTQVIIEAIIGEVRKPK